MAEQQVNIGVKVTTNLSEANKESAEFNSNMQSAAKAASSIRVPSQTAAFKSSAASSTSSAQESAGLNRGATGVGGSDDSKDFARQAQGLGGLVHVYATFAANIFAVSAAFTALSKAADFTNMIKGMDQLGAASGQALGSLAKRITQITDGAISSKQAVEAAVQATAGGLSGAQIERLAGVAKNASQALGRDMGDALSRLSRGITKIEPELLDELGIMVKVDTATRNYALSLGKSVTSLTDFEKHQAYTTAVLEEGERKFNSIKLDANPYQKLLASFTNIAITGGELINKVLGPIAKLLGESPAALTAAMAGLAALLLTKAIPALTKYKQALFDTALASQKIAATARDDAVVFDASGKIAAGRKAADPIQLQAGLAEVAMTNALIAAKSKLVDAAKAGEATDKLKSQILEELNIKTQKLAETEDRQATALSENNTKSASALAGSITKQKASLEAEKVAYDQATIAVDKHTEAARIQEEAIVKAEKNFGRATVGGSLQVQADKAATSFAKLAVSAAVVNDVKLGGFNYAIEQLNNNIKATSIELVNAKGQLETFTKVPLEGQAKSFALIKGWASAAATSIMTIASSFGNVFMVVGIVIAVFSVLDSVLSSNSKNTEKYKESIEALTTAAEAAHRVFEAQEKAPNPFATSASIIASATAFNELSTSLHTVVIGLDKVKVSMYTAFKVGNIWEPLVDAVKSIGSADIKSKTTKAISEMLISSIQVASNTDGAKIKAAIAEIITPKNFSPKGIQDALDSISTSALEDKVTELNKQIEKVNKDMGNSAFALKAYNEAAGLTEKAVGALVQSFAPTDLMGKFGIAQMEQASKLAIAIKDPIKAITLLSETVQDVNKLSLFPKGSQTSLIRYREDLKVLQDAASTTELQIKKLTAEIELTKQNGAQSMDLKKGSEKGDLKFSDSTIAGLKFSNPEDGKKAELEARLTAQVTQLRAIEVHASNTLSLIAGQGDLVAAQYKAGAEKLALSLNLAKEQASLNVDKAATAGLSGPGTASAAAEISRRELAIQQRILEAQGDVLDSQERLRLTIEALDLTEQKKLTTDPKKLKDLDEAYKKNAAIQTTSSGANVVEVVSNLTKEISRLQLSGSKEDAIQADVLSKYKNQLAGFAARTDELRAKGTAINIGERLGIVNEELVVRQRLLDESIKLKEIDLTRYASMQELTPIYNEQLNSLIETTTKAKEAQEIQKKFNELEKASAEAKIRRTGADSNSLREDIGRSKEDKLKALLAEIDVLRRTFSQNDLARTQSTTKAKQASEELIRDELIKQEGYRSQLATTRNSTAISELESQKTLGTVSEERYIQEKKSLELIGQQLAYNNSLRDLANSQAKETDATELALKNAKKVQSKAQDAIGANGVPTKEQYDEKFAADTSVSNISGQLATQATTQALATSALNADNEAKKIAIGLNTTVSEQIRLQTSLVAQLGEVFGTLGSAVGKAVNAITTGLESQANIEKSYNDNKLKDQATLNKDLEDIDKNMVLNEQGKLDAKNALRSAAGKKDVTLTAKYEKDKEKQTLNTDIAILDSTKQLFSKKTAAYKIMDAVEKGMQVARLANTLLESGTKIAAWFAEVPAKVVAEGGITAANTAGVVERAPLTIAGIMGKAYSDLGPIAGPIAGAALVASFISLLGGHGGGSASAVPDYKQKQETQGTGQDWTNDKEGKLVKVDNGRGVLGDSSAKSESIANSIEILKNNSIEGLNYDNKMLKAMERVASAVGAAAVTLYSIKGLTSGTGFGTGEGVISSSSGFLGIGKSSTTAEIKDAGVQINGTVSALIRGVGVIQKYKDVLVTSSNSGFLGIGGSSHSKTITDTEKLTGKITTQIGDIYKNASTVFGAIAKDAGLSSDDVIKTFESLPVNISASLMKLSGADLSKALGEMINAGLDDAATTIFASFDKYKEFGEGMLQTVTRVVDGNNKVRDALSIMGSTFDVTANRVIKVTPEIGTKIIDIAGHIETRLNPALQDAKDNFESISRGALLHIPKTIQVLVGEVSHLANGLEQVDETLSKFDISEALITGAGSLSNFVDQAKFFSENFVPLADKISPITTKLNATLGGLGLSGIKTREQLYAVVKGLDLSTKAGREMYQSLMDLAPAFNQTRGAVEDANKGWQEQLDVLTGARTQLAIDKAKDLATAIDDTTISLINQVYAQKELKEASDNVATALTASATAASNYASTMQGNANKALAAVDAAMQSITKAINAQKKKLSDQNAADNTRYNESISLLTKNLDKLKAIVTAVKSTIDTIRGATTDPSIAREQAKAQVAAFTAAAKADGPPQDIATIQNALATLAKPSDTMFATRTDWLLDAARTTSLLQDLQDTTETQVVTTESLLDTANKELKDINDAFKLANETLDAQLATSQALVDAMHGIDTSILSVSDAIDNLNGLVNNVVTSQEALLEAQKAVLAISEAKVTQTKSLVDPAATKAAISGPAATAAKSLADSTIAAVTSSKLTASAATANLIAAKAISAAAPGSIAAQKAVKDAAVLNIVAAQNLSDNADISAASMSASSKAATTAAEDASDLNTKAAAYAAAATQASADAQKVADTAKQASTAAAAIASRVGASAADAATSARLAAESSAASATAQEAASRSSEASAAAVATASANLTAAGNAVAAAAASIAAAATATAAHAGVSAAMAAAPPGVVSSLDLVSAAYKTVLGRTPEAAGASYWTHLVDTGALNSSNILSAIAAGAQGTDIASASAWAAANKVPAHAMGGTAKPGLALVGEQGPELVHFGSPGQVSTAGQTMKMFGELAEEIRQLRITVVRQQAALDNIAIYTKSTKDTLIRVSRDGNALVTTT